MTSRKKILASALLIAGIVGILFFANKITNSSFELLAYKEGGPITTQINGTTYEGRSVEAYHSMGISREFDSNGNLQSSNFLFWFPATISAQKAPNQVVYRSLQKGIEFSLPHGSKSSELTVPGEDATSYMQLWVHIDTGENSSGYYDSDGKEFELPCLNSLQPSFFEIELKYQDGSQSIKQYSIFPDKLNASGNLESIIIAEG